MKRRVAALAVVSMISSGAPAIEVHQAAPIRVVPSPPPPRVVPSPSEPPMVVAPGPREEAGAGERAGDQKIPSAVFGHRWRLRVPGAAWQTENRVEGTRTLHVSPGSGRLPHELVISPKGGYRWTAYGKQIRGQWVPHERDGYPLTLKGGYEGKDWHVTMSNGELLLWDGNSLAGQFRGE